MNAPPLLVTFTSLDSYFKALPSQIKLDYSSEIEELLFKKLPPVVSIRCLATLFGFSPKFMGTLYRCTDRYYRTFYIKKGKKKREINSPKVALKIIQKWFGYYLEKAITFDDLVYGFISGKSSVQAASVHCGAKWVYSIDIENFFQTTPNTIVKSALNSLGYSEHGAELISKLSSFKGFLAQGSPASPVLSNLCFSSVDNILKSIAKEYGVRYTRYADDICFSGAEDFPTEIEHRVNNVFNNLCWKLSDKKRHFACLPQRLKVYGLLVHGNKPRLTKGYRNRIRAFEHLIQSGKVKDEDILKINGHIAYSKSVTNF